MEIPKSYGIAFDDGRLKVRADPSYITVSHFIEILYNNIGDNNILFKSAGYTRAGHLFIIRYRPKKGAKKRECFLLHRWRGMIIISGLVLTGKA
jgi:hypothetical protein